MSIIPQFLNFLTLKMILRTLSLVTSLLESHYKLVICVLFSMYAENTYNFLKIQYQIAQ